MSPLGVQALSRLIDNRCVDHVPCLEAAKRFHAAVPAFLVDKR
jgi:hypothetical protein